MMKNTTLYLLIIFLLPLVGFAQPFHQHLYYDGEFEYIEAGHNDAFRPQSEIAIEMWVNPNTLNEGEELLRNYRDDNYTGYVITYNDGKLRLMVGGRGNVSNQMANPAISIVQDGKTWQHIAFTYDGQSMYAYLNGVLIASKDFGNKLGIDYGIPLHLSGLRIGGYRARSWLSKGLIDEVRIWNKALSLSEIKSMMHYEIEEDVTGEVKLVDNSATISSLIYCKHLAVYYRFNENTVVADGVIDNSCNGNNANYVEMDDSNIRDRNTGRVFISIKDGRWGNKTIWDRKKVPSKLDDIVIVKHKVIIRNNSTNLVDLITVENRVGNNGGMLVVNDNLSLKANEVVNYGVVKLRNNASTEVTNIFRNKPGAQLHFDVINVINGKLHNESNIYVTEGVDITVTSDFVNNFDLTYTGDLPSYSITIGGDFIHQGSNNRFRIGDRVRMNVKGVFENNGIFTINSTASGTGSLITSSDVINTGTFKVERWLDKGKTWQLFSSPMNKEESMVLYGHLLNEYNEAAGSFKSIKNTDYKLVVGDGYVAKLKYALDDNKPNPIVFSKDAPNNGDIDIELVDGIANDYFGFPDEFNLVGNPYPSPIDFHEVWSDNRFDVGGGVLKSNMYYYVDGSTSEGELENGWHVYNVQTSIGDPKDRFVNIGQAFGVEGAFIDGGNKTLKFKNTHRTHEIGNGFRKKDNSHANYFELVSSSNSIVDRSYFRFNENTTNQFDSGYDAYKLNSFGVSPTTSFISDDNKKMAICEMPETESVDLGFNMSDSGNVTFSVDNVYDFTAIILEDKENGVRTDLMKDDYTFSYSIGDDQQGRFTIHFKKDVLSDDIKELDGMLVYSTNSEVTINTPSELNDVNVGIYDMNGQLMLLKQYSNLKEETIETNLYEGIYILKIDSQEGTFSSKLRLQN